MEGRDKVPGDEKRRRNTRRTGGTGPRRAYEAGGRAQRRDDALVGSRVGDWQVHTEPGGLPTLVAALVT